MQRKESSHLLVHSLDACNGQSWAGAKSWKHNPSLPNEWQDPSFLSLHYCVLVCTLVGSWSKELELRARPQTWDRNILISQHILPSLSFLIQSWVFCTFIFTISFFLMPPIKAVNTPSLDIWGLGCLKCSITLNSWNIQLRFLSLFVGQWGK